MSPIKIKLELPFDFQPDPILQTATPEQRAIILTTGCVALKALLDEKDSLTNEEAYKKATAKWLGEKSQLEEMAEKEKKDILAQKADEVSQLNQKLTETETLLANAEIKAKTLLKSQDANILEERNRTRAQVESEKTAVIEQLKTDLEKAIDAAEKASSELDEAKQKAAEAAVQAEKAKNEAVNAEVQKVREELNQELKEERDRNRASAIRTNKSVLIGRDNEDAFAQLLDHSFGIGGQHHYRRLPQVKKSGDHLIEWKEIKIMFENKKYSNCVPTKEVDKAIRDFESNKNCDVLVFVSEDSSIVKRQRYFDITHVADGRPAIWIGEFSRNEDRIAHLQLVGHVAEKLVSLLQKRENGEEIVDYQNKVKDLIQSFKDTKVDLDNLLKLQKTCQREHNATWNKMKLEIVSVIARIGSRQSDANGNNKEEDDGKTGAQANSEPKAKKPRKTPMKNWAPQQSKNYTMLNYVNKSPLQVLASGHQQPQQQEGSKGLSAEVGDNKAKLKLYFQTNQ
ncbi:uncharacterized protein LOC124316258 [Daphnia pulicaria]|uniref:uncharacterized protein LOC124316258 n=1 Tax=Daphnia pulicaria TaxID=35523 RepID=UPI001EEC78DD|nr:uncharacterized protein LOC124316258 [Daphnia pulicaria]